MRSTDTIIRDTLGNLTASQITLTAEVERLTDLVNKLNAENKQLAEKLAKHEPDPNSAV